MIHSFRNLTLEDLEDKDKRMEGNESKYFPQYIHPSYKGKQDLFGEWLDSIECLDASVSDKPINMEVDGESTDYMDEDSRVLMLSEERTYWEPTTIVEAITELKNWAWEGVSHLMEDSLEKIKTIEPLIPGKRIISIPIDSIFASIFILIESICDHLSIPIESIFVESVKNSTPYNVIFDSAYLLALNDFISEIGKETLNNEELK